MILIPRQSGLRQMSKLTTRIRDRLAAPGRPSSDFDLNSEVVLPKERVLRSAGVLLAIVDGPDGPSVLLTKRSSALKHHPGQIAFPGGKQDDSDVDVVASALREAEEEVGLSRNAVEVLGTLPPHETVTGFVVTPVIGRVTRAFDIIPEAGEVDEAFFVPLDFLIQTENYTVQSRRWRGTRRHYYTVPYGPYYIWGATARMLLAFADRMA